jgi:hypothetical protein
MTFHGAIVKEQGVTFAVVIVKRHVLRSRLEAVRAQRGFSAVFPGVPIVLMAQDARGIPTYHGRADIVRFLAGTPVSCIPWKSYTFN